MYQLLDGIRVLDFSAYVTDVVGCHFADMGAEVIKVEAPPMGSLSRLVEPYVMHLGRNKKSLGIDLKKDDAKAVFARLVKESDIIVDALRSGALDALGFGYEDVIKLNPKIVYLSVSGWGQTGPYRRLASHGQSFDTFSSVEPVVVEDGVARSVYNSGHELAGQMGCSFGVIAALSALIRAQKTGEGVHIDVSEGEAGAWYFWSAAYGLLNQPEDERKFVPPSVKQEEPRTRYRVYCTKDGTAVFLQALEKKFWVNFCNGLDRVDLAERGNWSMGLDAGGYEGEFEELCEIFQTRTQQEWLQFFIDHDVAGGPTNTLVDLLQDPHFVSREPFVEVDDFKSERKRKMLGTPVKIKGEQFVPNSPPAFGRDTDGILGELGLSAAEVKSLHESGAVQ
ncbi:MAG: CaiB/BaiF CoA-transferase family protein [Kiritimatiellia bacterium]|jgi:crotonobetainyl-CoA:carnitine CoA-transferase CaiB-like acyl-CoA transferase|nr:CaiB/BaiF CoA-transferase family protein [Pseudomonadales bacterium]MDP6473239.1 CaiB/BaiF CoA-transferase family protein [Pseudomonadales bacterium]MDP6829164.1 CaiB/BaiF CoA-transferase family protein [Pseudomonadales bacterium]MDP7024711.1 CaiB/BaiF CoA-transferase family protein [Kiritimatiellia bacterium]|tara:strand:- start:1188 stop:2369 length:1182 start_codon:yes stop_codon:yes gene_type:complete